MKTKRNKKVSNEDVMKALEAVLKNKDEIMSDDKPTSALGTWKAFKEYQESLNQKENK